MNVFLKALLSGKITPTSMLERKMNAMPGKVERYHQVEQSKELQEFEKLDAFVKSNEFQANQDKLARIKELESHRRIRLFCQLQKKADLQKYLEWAKDDVEYSKLADKEAVKKSIILRKMQKVDASSDLYAWKELEKSEIVDEYLRLKGEVVDYSSEIKRHAELSKNENIKFYLNTDKRQIQRYDESEKLFEDDFTQSQINMNGWKAGFAYPDGFQSVHSYANEKQAYTGGQNIKIKDSILYINTQKEGKNAAAWDDKKGMIMKDFEYTSDVIHNTYAFEEGSVLQVKVRCRGFLNHGIYLRSKKHVPFISIFNYTNGKVYCGLKANLKEDDYKHEVKDLKPLPFSIYTLVWGKDEIIWYLNDMEIYRTKNIIPKGEKMYLHLYSFQFLNKFTSSGTLEVDWVKAYKM